MSFTFLPVLLCEGFSRKDLEKTWHCWVVGYAWEMFNIFCLVALQSGGAAPAPTSNDRGYPFSCTFPHVLAFPHPKSPKFSTIPTLMTFPCHSLRSSRTRSFTIQPTLPSYLSSHVSCLRTPTLKWKKHPGPIRGHLPGVLWTVLLPFNKLISAAVPFLI